MAEQSINKLRIGTKASEIKGIDQITGKDFSLNEFKDRKGFVIAFICNHCPYVKLIESHLPSFAEKYAKLGIGFVAVNSNDIVSYPEDSPEQMKKRGVALNFNFPYIFDQSQKIAENYGAVCTPEFFLFSSMYGLQYHGRYDNAMPGNKLKVTGFDLALAIENLLSGKPALSNQMPAMGCSIKWK